MKVLGIAGSPRRQGNTELMLDKALEGAKSVGAETEKIILNELKFVPCQECGGCNETGECVVKDDMQIIYEKMRQADAIIVASPIFFGSASAQTKMMIDRFQCWWVAKYILKRSAVKEERKKGLFLCAGGFDKSDFFKDAKRIIKIFFTVSNIKYEGDLFCPGVDKKGEVLRHPAVLDKAFDLGKALVS